MRSPAFPMWQPAGINLTPRKKICPQLCYKLLQSKTGPVLGTVSPVVKSQPARVSRVVKSRPVATRSSISSSKGDPKCGLELMTLTSLTTYAGTWFQSVVWILALSCQGYPRTDHASRVLYASIPCAGKVSKKARTKAHCLWMITPKPFWSHTPPIAQAVFYMHPFRALVKLAKRLEPRSVPFEKVGLR